MTALIFEELESGQLTVQSVILRHGDNIAKMTKVAEDVLTLFAKAVDCDERDHLLAHSPAEFEA